MKYVLDSSAWYAWTITTDRYHLESSQIIEKNPELVVPFAVFEELNALIFHRFGKTKTVEALQPLLDSDRSTITLPTKIEANDLWHLFLTCSPNIDYVDASVYYYSRKLKLPIFTFDSHFRDFKPKPHLHPR
jgi:predicted nucleic acid-binding protein